MTSTVKWLSAPEGDGLADAATLTHTALGGGYGGVSGVLPAAVDDGDTGVATGAARLSPGPGATFPPDVCRPRNPDRRRRDVPVGSTGESLRSDGGLSDRKMLQKFTCN